MLARRIRHVPVTSVDVLDGRPRHAAYLTYKLLKTSTTRLMLKARVGHLNGERFSDMQLRLHDTVAIVLAT